MEKLCFLFKKYKEIIMYLIFGVLTTLVSLVCYSLFVELFRFSITVSSVFSWIIAVSFAFVTNKLWVFQSKSWAGNVVFPELGKFLSSRVATGIFEMVAVPALVAIGLNQTIFGIDGMVSKVVVSVAVIVLNYILSKLFVFKK